MELFQVSFISPSARSIRESLSLIRNFRLPSDSIKFSRVIFESILDRVSGMVPRIEASWLFDISRINSPTFFFLIFKF
jgi:hypothetical protein